MEQLAEHLADLQEAGGELRALQHFQFLPPAGLLAREAVDFDFEDGFQSLFFPPTYHLVASPVPLAEVDAALEQSAALPPIALRPSEVPQVEILVPVPEDLYDPRLLVREEIDPEFGETTARFLERRGEQRQRRDDVRGKHDVLAQAIDGETPTYPTIPRARRPRPAPSTRRKRRTVPR